MGDLHAWGGMVFEAIAVFGRLLVGGLFAVSLLGKLADPHSFSGVIRGYRLLPRSAVMPAAVLVMLAEAATVVLVSTKATALFGLGLAGFIVVGYALAMGAVLRRGTQTRCGCFHRLDTVRTTHIWRNLLVAGVCGVAAVAVSRGGPAPTPRELLLLVVAAVAAVASVVFLPDLVLALSPAKARPPRRRL